jgi:hypothetical protein
MVTLAGGSDLDSDLPGDRALRGIRQLPGFEQGELRVDGYWLASTSYLWKVKDLLPIRNLAFYMGISVTGGQVSRPPRRRR